MTATRRGVANSRHIMSDAELSIFVQKVHALRAEGLSWTAIGERFGVPPSTIHDRLARLRKLEEKS